LSAELSDAEKRELPCFQNPGPWQDSTHLPTLKWAARKCVTDCLQREWCDSERLSTLDEWGTATGVWAGRIWSHRDVCTIRLARTSDTSE
jgi:hypothetical protein